MKAYGHAVFRECLAIGAQMTAEMQARQVDALASRAACAATERSAAVALVSTLTKNAARRYARQPMYLDAISPGLGMAHPRMLIARIETMQMVGSRPRHIGFGGMVQPINLRGAKLLGRYQRRFGTVPQAAR